jgi:20S proteasome alpha/beta subunit
MTAVVGVLCEDGVVMGTDSSATFTTGTIHTIEQKTKKIDIVGSSVIIAGTGQIGLGQRFVGLVNQAYTDKIFQKPYLEVGRLISKTAIENFASTQCDKMQYGALLAYASGNHVHLCEFAVKDFQPEWKNSSLWYVSLGCGQQITDPFLGFMRRIYWKDKMPKIEDATFIVIWAIQNVIDLNAGGINGPIQLAVLRHRTGEQHFQARIFTDDELREHMGNVTEAEEYIGKFKAKFCDEAAPTIPTVNTEERK